MVDENFSDILEIDHKILSRNILDRMHWAAKMKLKNLYRILIRNKMKLNKINSIDDYAKIQIEVYNKRLMDIDNVWGGLKPFIDALRHEKYIHDDSPKYLDIEVKQIKSKNYKIITRRKYAVQSAIHKT